MESSTPLRRSRRHQWRSCFGSLCLWQNCSKSGINCQRNRENNDSKTKCVSQRIVASGQNLRVVVTISINLFIHRQRMTSSNTTLIRNHGSKQSILCSSAYIELKGHLQRLWKGQRPKKKNLCLHNTEKCILTQESGEVMNIYLRMKEMHGQLGTTK